MSRYFLFGTLMWDRLRADVAGQPVACVPAALDGWHVERAEAGDWPVLVPGGQASGYLTDVLDAEARARLDWYETVFDYVPESVEVTGPDGMTNAMVYRPVDAPRGAGVPWDLDDWVTTHGARTREAASEVMRAMGRVPIAEVAARRGVIQARAQGIVANRLYDRPATVGAEARADSVRIERVDYPYEGFHRVEEWHLDHPQFDGGRSGVIQRAVSHVTDAATVLPYDPVRDRVLVVEQIRVGVLAKGEPRPWMIEPVAGLIDAGETAEAAALRELEEESNIKVDAQALRFIARYYPSPGGLAQVIHSYTALCDLPDEAAGLHGLAEEHEDIRAHLVPLDDLAAMIATGEAANAPLILSAQWLLLNRAALRG